MLHKSYHECRTQGQHALHYEPAKRTTYPPQVLQNSWHYCVITHIKPSPLKTPTQAECAHRKAMPVSFPLSAGNTFPTALAAPVAEGMMLVLAPRARPASPCWTGRSTVFCVAVGGVHRRHQPLHVHRTRSEPCVTAWSKHVGTSALIVRLLHSSIQVPCCSIP